MSIRAGSIIAPALIVITCIGTAGCGGDEIKYEPKPPPKVKATMPPVPNVPQRPIRQGDKWTVWGASYYLRSRVHRKDVAGKDLTFDAYITKTNLPSAPECAVHKGGKADPEGCKAPIPAFWISDKKDAQEGDSIKVMGWASNFAQIYDAIEEIDKKGADKAEPQDTFWGIPIPVPLPAKGAKVTLTGRFSTTFTGASTGTEADPIMGLIHYQKMEYVEPAAEKSTLPGVERKEK